MLPQIHGGSISKPQTWGLMTTSTPSGSDVAHWQHKLNALEGLVA